MNKIELTQGKKALVDNENFERLNSFKWCYHRGYAIRSIKNQAGNGQLVRRMHWYVIGKAPKGLEIDHL